MDLYFSVVCNHTLEFWNIHISDKTFLITFVGKKLDHLPSTTGFESKETKGIR